MQSEVCKYLSPSLKTRKSPCSLSGLPRNTENNKSITYFPDAYCTLTLMVVVPILKSMGEETTGTLVTMGWKPELSTDTGSFQLTEAKNMFFLFSTVMFLGQVMVGGSTSVGARVD